MSIKGFKSQQALQQKLKGYSEDQSVDQARYVTVQESAGRRHMLDTHIRGVTAVNATPQTIAVGSNIRTIVCTAHGASKNDVIRLSNGTELSVLSIPDANTIITSVELDVDPTGDTFTIWRHVTPSYNPDGSISASSGPIQYNTKSGGVTTTTTVLEDLDTPANSRSMPVSIHSVNGAPINITAGDLNVQLSDRGANPDATRIGDGTNLLGINSSNEAKVSDAVLASTISTDGGAQPSSGVVVMGHTGVGTVKHILVDTNGIQSVNVNNSALPTGAATSANQSTQISSLSSIDTKLSSQATALNQTNQSTLFGDLVETAPASDTASSGLNGRLQRIAQRLSSLIALLPATIGQKLMAGSMSVTIASDQGAIGSVQVSSSALPTGSSTSANQTLQLAQETAINTVLGLQADAVATTDTGTFSLISLVKKVAQNITSMAAQLPATLGIKTSALSLSITSASDAKFAIKPSTITTTYAENLALTTVTTITAPANAVSVLVMADDTNANNIRVKQNATASLTSGFPLQAGRDITFDGGQDLSVISDNAGSAGASVKIYFSWKIQA